MSARALIRLVVALRCEASPLIDALGLARVDAAPALRCYAARRDEADVELVISGVGKHAAAAAVSSLQGRRGGEARWLNVGLAGHAQRPLGEALIGDAIVDVATGRALELTVPRGIALPRVTLHTFDAPTQGYPSGDVAVEMEAFAFAEAARRFAPEESIHALKVVSDNAESVPLGRDAARARQLIEGALPVIRGVLSRLTEEKA